MKNTPNTPRRRKFPPLPRSRASTETRSRACTGTQAPRRGKAAAGAKERGELPAANTNTGRLQRALLARLTAHKREGTLPTSHRFLLYELIQAGIVPKHVPGGKRNDSGLIGALTYLRDAGKVPWADIVDETRELDQFVTSASVLDYVIDAAAQASLDRWDGNPPPLIICESRSLARVLRETASAYACPIASTNGMCRGFLINEVAPHLVPGQRVLYFGDWDRSGHQIEGFTKRTLMEHAPKWAASVKASELMKSKRKGRTNTGPLWERVALTDAQVASRKLPVIQKLDRRTGKRYDAVETEALGQAEIVNLLRNRLDELMPEPLKTVLARERAERAEVAEQLRELRDES